MTETLGGYRLLEEIGRGATASIRLAEDAEGRRVALKILHPSLAMDGAVRERFRREALAARSLRHPGIAAVWDLIQEDGDAGRIAIVMEWCPGGNLEAWRMASPEELRDRGEQLARALAAAHRAGIVHRDLKPSNVLVGVDGKLRIADFGSARVREFSSMTTSSSFVASPLWMAPESLAGGCPDPRWDLYSLGAILYRAATGRSHRERPGSALLAAPPPPPHPSDLEPSLPRAVGDIIMALLGPIGSRPRSALELADALASGAFPAKRGKECLFCGQGMAADALICPSCLCDEPIIRPKAGGLGLSIVLTRLSEEASTLSEFLRVLRVLSGDPSFSPRFLTEDRRLYSKNELARSVPLPCRLLGGLDQAAVDLLVPALEGVSGKIKTEIKTDEKAERDAVRRAKRLIGFNRKEKEEALQRIKEEGVPPLIRVSKRFDRVEPWGTDRARLMERQALALLFPRAGAEPDGTSPAPDAEPAAEALGCRELVQAASTGIQERYRDGSLSSTNDALGLEADMAKLLAAAARIKARMDRIAADIAEISPGRLQATIRRLSELLALEDGPAAAAELMVQKRRAEEAYERYTALERERASLAALLLEASTEMERGFGGSSSMGLRERMEAAAEQGTQPG